jgi:serine/threonine protein kinase
MLSCVFDEKLTHLLADDLSTAEGYSVARHVESCASCQEQLAHLSATSDDKTVSIAKPQCHCTDSEDGLMRRLKEMPTIPWKGARPFGRLSHPEFTIPPTVPGYDILGELGRGGMGVVYEARHLGLNRIVALKMILAGGHADPKELARFRVEAEVIARLQHANIVQIYDVGEAEGRPYFVLEFVAGGSLAQYLQGTPQPARPAAQLIEILARAVHAAHTNGVIHRDLKPANILLEDSGPGGEAASLHSILLNPKITDFGVAKRAAAEGVPDRGPTVTGELLGTPNYVAPEQAMGSRRAVGPAADVYSLGAILYELLTGRPPFMGETPLATVLQVLHNEPVSVTTLQPNVSRDIETICLKCLSKDPSKRYGSALELAQDVQRFLRDEPIRARPVSSKEKLRRWVRHHPVTALHFVLIISAFVLGILFGGSLVVVWLG